MKMTKIKSARIIVKRKGDCRGIQCTDCFRVNFCDNEEITTEERMKRQFADATAYIKRHEDKSRKKAANKIKNAFQSDKISIGVDLASGESKTIVQETKDPTPLEIAKMIRDNKYNCNLDFFECSECPLKPQYFHCLKDRKTLIDTYISEHDHVEDKSEMVEPVGNTEKLESVILKKVVCIDNNLCDIMLTVGKEYVVLSEHNGFFYIKENDCNNGDILHKSRFITTEEYAKRVNIQDVEPVIEPIKFDDPVPEYVYKVTSFGIFEYICVQFNECFNKEFGKSISRTFSVLVKQVDGEAKWDSNTENYYSTPEKAFTVFMKARRK